MIEALAAIKSDQEELQRSITKISVELAVLKVKAGFWGSVAGVLVGGTAILIDYFIRK